jgi:hypothetical protein
MPEMNGDEVSGKFGSSTRDAGKNERKCGYGEQEVVSRFEENNLSGFVQKPYQSRHP